MKVLSTNVGRPKNYEFRGASVRSSMRREPTLEGLHVYFDHVAGDKFAVVKLHGIKEAIVYAMSADSFAPLSKLYEQSVGAGMVGENLTLDQLDESNVMIGDEYSVGETILRATGPRYPCNRLNFCFQREDAMQRFAELRRPGVYYEVVQEGAIRTGDQMRLSKSAGGDLSVLQLFDHLTALKDVSAGRRSRADIAPMARAVVANHLVPGFLRARFEKFV